MTNTQINCNQMVGGGKMREKKHKKNQELPSKAIEMNWSWSGIELIESRSLPQSGRFFIFFFLILFFFGLWWLGCALIEALHSLFKKTHSLTHTQLYSLWTKVHWNDSNWLHATTNHNRQQRPLLTVLTILPRIKNRNIHTSMYIYIYMYIYNANKNARVVCKKKQIMWEMTAFICESYTNIHKYTQLTSKLK